MQKLFSRRILILTLVLMSTTSSYGQSRKIVKGRGKVSLTMSYNMSHTAVKLINIHQKSINICILYFVIDNSKVKQSTLYSIFVYDVIDV
jgi:hypothetical protein